MTRALLVLLALAAVLAALDAHLQRSADSERRARARVGRMVPETEREGWQLTAVEVADASGRVELYLPYYGRWRCRTKDGAPVDVDALQRLVEGLTGAEGVVHAESPRDPAAYGVGTPTTWRVTLHGPAAAQPPHQDPLASFDLGTPLEGRDACYVRRVGEARVWLLEANPRAPLDAPPYPGLPPLLAPHVVPADWPGWAAGLARVRLEEPDGTRFVLERRVPPPDPAADPRERPPFLWVLDPGPTEALAAQLQATAYTLFLQRLPYVDVQGPRELEALGLDRPTLAVVLEPAEGEPLRLAVAPPLSDGRVPVWNEDTGRPYLLDAEVGDLLAPPRAAFEGERDDNPWDPYLRR